ncbi:unnamed protein product [Phytophthora lilii]|uniref:Unnamed protein product n=1 Tax=Phytophthora lilii TaxID=2077276 RepID=A0A9W6X224_9STRA|nr:unnamed protein product [Phytophthora lilii]
MAGRTNFWGESPQPRRASDSGSRRRHDQQRLLVELELDDSMYQGSLRAGIRQNARNADSSRTSYTVDGRHSFHPSYGHDSMVDFESKPRSQSLSAKPLTERQMQQLHAKRLSSPYKLKQQVLGSRNDPTQQRYHQEAVHRRSSSSAPISTRSPVPQTSAHIVIEAVRQNIHLRDQVIAHLQQELMGVLPLHRGSHVEKNVPQRVVKLLNRMRSLSLAVVEAVVYLNGELKDQTVAGASDILENDFYGYLLQMASSDTDFIACSPPLQRFFEDFEVSLTRNPFVEGLSLDSSEVLLCACHQNTTSSTLFCSASSSSSSLLRLLMHKLETFALQTQRYLPGWQGLPVERVAAALLHLMDLEARFNAVRMLPRYLQSQGDNRRQFQRQHGIEKNKSYGYGTFEDERIQRLDRQDSRISLIGGHDSPHSPLVNIPVMEAWAGSPTPKPTVPVESRPQLPLPNMPAIHLKDSHELVRHSSDKEESIRPSSASTGWTSESTTPTVITRTLPTKPPLGTFDNPPQPSLTPPSAIQIAGEFKSEQQQKVEAQSPQLVLPLDTSAAAKRPSKRWQSERFAMTIKSENEHDIIESRRRFVNAESQMSERKTFTDAESQVSERRIFIDSESQVGERRFFVDAEIQMSERRGYVDAESQMSERRGYVDAESQMTERLGCVDTEIHMSVAVQDEKIMAPNVSQQSLARSIRDESVDTCFKRFTDTESESRRNVQIIVKEIGMEGDYSTESQDTSDIAASAQQLELDVKPAKWKGSLDCDCVDLEYLPRASSPTIEKHRDGMINNATPSNNIVTSLPQSEEPNISTEDVMDNESGYGCDFEYSSTEALSNIALALQMLPHFPSSMADEVSKPEDAIPPILVLSEIDEYDDRGESTQRPEAIATPSSTCASLKLTGVFTRNESVIAMENAASEVEGAKMRDEMPPAEDDEYAYSSSTAVSNIAMALSLLPTVWQNDLGLVPEEHQEQPANFVDTDPPSMNTYRSRDDEQSLPEESLHSIEAPLVDPMLFSFPALDRSNIHARSSNGAVQTLLMSQGSYDPAISSRSYSATMTVGDTLNSSPVSSRSNASEMSDGEDLCTITSSTSDAAAMTRNQACSSRSNTSSAKCYQGDDESEEPSELNHIFALCRDIQVAAYDMSHWVAQREVEDHVQSVVQPFSALMGYSSPTATSSKADNSPKYLERELKMLRRNFVSWKLACADQKRARLVVRRLISRRKVRQFVLYHYRRRVQARIDDENRLRGIAALRIQRTWRLHCVKQIVFCRKAAFRLVHMAFHRTLFFLRISRRRHLRKFAKEKLVRWWRRQRIRIKKIKQRQEKNIREREQRARALRDIKKFLKEILLRRKLKAAQEMANNILFKEQLKWTKAKRDVERSMKLNSKHRRELIADMNARLADLDLRWKASEEERLQLLTHHERIVQQQQCAVEARRRRLAALKIQMFLKVCHLHKKLQNIKTKKKQCEITLQKELLGKQKLGVEAQKRICKTRTQVRVLDRKLNKMSREAMQTDARHHEMIQAHEAREKAIQKRSAQQQIKAFIDARVLITRARTEKHRLVLEQACLRVEKAEIELMSSEDQLEQRRMALSTESDLRQQLSELKARSEAILAAKEQLAIEKELEAQQAAATLEHSRIEASMHQIASWVSGQLKLSKLTKEKAAIRASAEHAMEEEKQKQRKAIEVRMREVISIKASSFMHQRVTQHRNQRTMEMIRVQQQQKNAQDRLIAERSRTQLVQVIMAVKLLSEVESTKGVAQALNNVIQLQKALKNKISRLNYLRSMNCARKIQRACLQWMHQQRVYYAQELALAYLEKAKQRQALARKIQTHWRKWIQEQQRRREQKRVFEEHLQAVRVRANARNIQAMWRRWVQREHERRYHQQLAFNAHLDAICTRANARKIQVTWRIWVRRESQRRQQQQIAFEAHLAAICTRAYAQKIQVTWRHWVQQEKQRRQEQQKLFDAHLEAIHVRANVRKMQKVWRLWVLEERKRRDQQQLVFEAYVKAIYIRANVRKIQGVWRRWVRSEQERRYQQQLAFDAYVTIIRTRAYARRIQTVWRRWTQNERERRHEQQLVFDAHVQAIIFRAYIRKIQRVWRCWIATEQERRLQQRLAFQRHLKDIHTRATARKIQRTWRMWAQSERERRLKQRLVFDSHLESIKVRASVRKIQAVWRRWARRERERWHQQKHAFQAHLQSIRVRVSVRKIQAGWKRWVQRQQARRYYQRIVFETHLNAIRTRATARKIQAAWRCWVQKERGRRHAQQLAFNAHLEVIRVKANVRKIQGAWRRWVKFKQAQRERKRVQELTFSSASRIQKWWRKWQQQQRHKAERVRILQETSAKAIQMKWRRWERWQLDKTEKTRIRIHRAGCARKLQKCWRQWHALKCRRELCAKRIQQHWEKWKNSKKEQLQSECARKAAEERAIALRIQHNWTRKRHNETEAELLRQENERKFGAALVIQQHWRKTRQLELEGQKLQQHACAYKIQDLWRTWHVRIRQLEKDECLKREVEQPRLKEDERLQQEYVTNVLKIQSFWRKEQNNRDKLHFEQTQNANSLKIQRNWGERQHRRKLEREEIQHKHYMAALKIQTRWLKWHHEQEEELDRERIRQEQYESSLKIQRNWGISHQRRMMERERIRHKQSISALKIQKHWRRWWHLRLNGKSADSQKPRVSMTTKLRSDAEQFQPNEVECHQELDTIKYRSSGRLIVRTLKVFCQRRREERAATKIEAIWKGKLYRMHYLQALELKRAQEIRAYRLSISVFATKVQVCWRRWHAGVRQVKRAVVKDDELRLIQEAKALERKAQVAKRTLASKRIQRALASRRRLQELSYISQKDITRKKNEAVKRKEPTDLEYDNELQNEEPVGDHQAPTEKDLTRASVKITVEDWSHRELPHILTRSVNQILFCHEVATVLQKCVRGYQMRQRMHFQFQQSFETSPQRESDLTTKLNAEQFHFYFKKASAWLEWDSSNSRRSVDFETDTNQLNSVLRLRFDAQVTRKLLQLFEPCEDYSISEIQQALQELASDARTIFQSPVCLLENDNPRPELCYYDVEEMELPHTIKLLRQMGQHHAKLRRQQLLEVNTDLDNPLSLSSVTFSKSTPSSPVGRSAPSSPSQRVQKEVTIFTAVESASIEDVIFLQQQGTNLAAVEPKMQRNALHMLSFSKEKYRARAEMLAFLLGCGAKLDINAVDCNGDTPLMLYASLGHLEFMQKLLEHGADIQQTNKKGQNVLHRACEDDQVEICGFLQQLMMKDSMAENSIPIETIKALAPSALTLHTPDSTGRYPLHCLVEKGFVECAKQIVVPTESNYDWNRILQSQGDLQGRTALHLAVLMHDAAMTSFLLTPGGGSNANAFDDLHRTPLHYAVESPAALPIISRLMQHGANLNVADERGDTPLHWAAFSGRALVAQNLLVLGADPTLANSDWETPAQIAAAYGQFDCMRLLLQAQRRYGLGAACELKDQQQTLVRPASEKTALQRLEEAVNHLHQKQASAHSYHAADHDTDLDALSTIDADGERDAAPRVFSPEQSHAGYWEELHQDVQLVEESGQFSSEDEEDLLFGHDGDDDLSF